MSTLLDWLKAAFSVQYQKKNEVNFPCPYCGHNAFYFNFRKKIGYCHRASCGRKPTLKDLIQIKGYGPTDWPAYWDPDPIIKITEKNIELPGVDLYTSRDNWAIDALRYRGISDRDICKWKITTTNTRIYIPIIQDYKIVQYVGRMIDRQKHPKDGFNTIIQPKYKYAEGNSISNFIFGWGEEMKNWKYLVLVENTFNAIAWRDKFNCSTNFGSNLSDAQIKLIYNSFIQKVILAWDDDAKTKVWNVAQKLSTHGIVAVIIEYTQSNQPDQVNFKLLEAAINTAIISAPPSYGHLIVRIEE